MREKKQKNMKKDSILKRIIVVLILLLISIFVLIKAENYLRESTSDQINLIINNRNVTSRLKNNIFIKG